MVAVIRAVKILFTFWSPWKNLDGALWPSTKRLYLTFIVPIAAIGPLLDLVIYLAAPFHSMLMPTLSLSHLLYIAIRDTISGVVVAFSGASLIKICGPYFGAVQNKLWTHQLAAIAICPVLLAIAVRPLFPYVRTPFELLAMLYGGYLLGSGLSATLGVKRPGAAAYAVLVVLGTQIAAWVGNIVVILLQLWVVNGSASNIFRPFYG